MKEFQTFGWYAAQISPHLPKEAFKPAPHRLLGGIAYLFIIVCSIVSISFVELSTWTKLLLSFILGLSFAGNGFLGHEILHGTIVKKPWLRNFIGAICFLPFATGPLLWRKWHNSTHHVHTQHSAKDPDTWSTAQEINKNPILRSLFRIPKFFRSVGYVMFLFINFNTHSTRMFIRFIKEFKPSKQPIVWLQFLLPWLFWLVLFFLIGPWKWLFAYVFPALLANFIVSSYIATNHNLNPQTDTNDPLANSLTVTVPKWIDLLHFNFSYHTEHHMFPSMNPKYYPLVKEHIKRMWPDRYHEMPYTKAIATLIKTPRIYLDETDLFDLHKGELYGSLGNGLNPNCIQYREIERTDEFPEKYSQNNHSVKHHQAVLLNMLL